jgi:hypothetical protein
MHSTRRFGSVDYRGGRLLCVVLLVGGVAVELRESATRKHHRGGGQVRSSVDGLRRWVSDGQQAARTIASQNADFSKTSNKVAN